MPFIYCMVLIFTVDFNIIWRENSCILYSDIPVRLYSVLIIIDIGIGSRDDDDYT